MVDKLKQAIDNFDESLYNKRKLIEYFGEDNLKRYPFRSIYFARVSDGIFNIIINFELNLDSFKLYQRLDLLQANEIKITDSLLKDIEKELFNRLKQ